MTYQPRHLTASPTRDAVDAMRGPVLVEFGTPWCGHCQRAQPLIEQALQQHPAVEHVKVEDGPGQRLGRTFGVKLWPTLIVMQDGQEVTRLVRPETAQAVSDALAQLTPAQ